MMQYDGNFEYNGELIDFIITDNDIPINNEKFSRCIHFYIEGKSLGAREIYGTVEQMDNIDSSDTKRWYEEGKEKGWLK